MAVTPNYGFTLPTVGGDDAVWGGFLNTNWSDLDTDLDVLQTDVDSRILTSDIGSAVQAFDATILVDADIGGSLQAWDTQLDTLAGVSAANAAAVGNLTGVNAGDEVTAGVSTEGVIIRSSSAQNITGTIDTRYPTVLGTKEMIDTHSPAVDSQWEFVENTYEPGDGTPASVESAAFADKFEYAFSWVNVIGTAGTRHWRIDLFGSTASAYSTSLEITVGQTQTADDAFGWLELKLSRVSSNVKPVIAHIEHDANISGNDVFSVSLNAFKMGFVHWATAQKTDKIRIKPSSGTFNSVGTIEMYRRPLAV